MAWTLFLARQGARAARETAQEFAEGDGILDHLFRIVMTVAVVVVFPVLLLVELTRQALIWMFGEPMSSWTAAKVLAVLAGLLLAAVLVHRSRRQPKGGPLSQVEPAPQVVGVQRRLERGATVRPLTGVDMEALIQIRTRAGDAAAVDAIVRALDFPVRRALASHGHIRFHIETARWCLR